MKESAVDIALQVLEKRMHLAQSIIDEQLKNVKPFDMKKMTDKERVDAFNAMSINDIIEFRSEKGDEAYYNYVNEMKALRRKVYAG